MNRDLDDFVSNLPSPRAKTAALAGISLDRLFGTPPDKLIALTEKVAFEYQDFLCRFEGTPLYDQAIALMEEDIKLEAENIQRRMRERLVQEPSEDFWTKRDMLRIKKQQLDLELAKLKSPAAAPAAAAPTVMQKAAEIASFAQLRDANRKDKANDEKVLELVNKTKKKVVEDIEDHEKVEKSAADKKLQAFARKERGEDKELLKKVQDAEEHVKDDIKDFTKLEKQATLLACDGPPGSGGDTFLSQFEGTPLYDQALQLCQRELEIETQRIRRRIQAEAERAAEPDFFLESEQLDLQKKQLALELAKTRAAQPAAPPDLTPKTSEFLEKIAVSEKWLGKYRSHGRAVRGPEKRVDRFPRNNDKTKSLVASHNQKTSADIDPGVLSSVGAQLGASVGSLSTNPRKATAVGGAAGGGIAGFIEGARKGKPLEGAARGAFGGGAGAIAGRVLGSRLAGGPLSGAFLETIGGILGANMGAKAVAEGMHLDKTAAEDDQRSKAVGAAGMIAGGGAAAHQGAKALQAGMKLRDLEHQRPARPGRPGAMRFEPASGSAGRAFANLETKMRGAAKDHLRRARNVHAGAAALGLGVYGMGLHHLTNGEKTSSAAGSVLTKAKKTITGMHPMALSQHMAKTNPAAAVAAGTQHGMPVVANHATLAQLDAMPFHKLQSDEKAKERLRRLMERRGETESC